MKLVHRRENREQIESLKFKLAELNETVNNQAITIRELDVEVEDLKNRSLRKTLIFRNIKKQQSEKTWDDTKMVLANEISKNMQHLLKEEMPTETPLQHQHHLFFVAKITNWDMSGKIKSAIIKANQEGTSTVFVPQMYSKVSDRKKKCGFEVPSRSQ